MDNKQQILNAIKTKKQVQLKNALGGAWVDFDINDSHWEKYPMFSSIYEWRIKPTEDYKIKVEVVGGSDQECVCFYAKSKNPNIILTFDMNGNLKKSRVLKRKKNV